MVGHSGEEMFAEAEIVFEMDRDLPPAGAPYSREAVAAAIKGVYARIEIVRTRFASSDLPLALLIADNVMGHGLLLGQRLSRAWEETFAAMPVVLHRGGERTLGSTDAVMDDPLDALVWLANWLCTQETGLQREQLIASGSYTGATEILPGDTIMADFAGLARAQVTLSDG